MINGSRSGTPGACGAARIVPSPAVLFLIFMGCVVAAACSVLKPASDTGRHFVLTSLVPSGKTADPPAPSRVDMVRVRVPSYLGNSSLAIRTGTNEIVYPPGLLWAERPDSGIARVLAADLSSLLPGETVRVGAAASDDVAREISVTIEQFDVDSAGLGVLVARWRILQPIGERQAKSGESRLQRTGPPPASNPSGAVGTLSELVADLGRQLAQALSGT